MAKRWVPTSTTAKPVPPGFIDWREFDPSWLPGGSQARFATELVTYRDHLDELLPHQGRFVVIHGTSILGHYRDRRAALVAAHGQYGATPVLIKQIVAREPVRRLGRAALELLVDKR